MFYQNILTELSPYMARMATIGAFGEHRHADIEMHYCTEGSLEIFVNKKSYTVKEGQLLLISPMVAHAFPPKGDGERRTLTLIVGVSFLKKFFSYFSGAKDALYIIDPHRETPIHTKLFSALEEITILCETREEKNDLLIRGNLCKICSYLIDLISDPIQSERVKNKEMVKVATIEKALEMIYYDYAKPLTVEDAANATGYGKSNFCKIFKSITGDTFHNVLNRQRVESACALLDETDLPVATVALQVGFEETKTFCRVFKAITSQTPGQYRKKK